MTNETAIRRIQAALRIVERDTTLPGEAKAAQAMVDRELAKSGMTLSEALNDGKAIPVGLREKVVDILENASGRKIARKIIENGVPVGIATGTGYGVTKAEGGSEDDARLNALLFGAMQALSSVFHKEPNEEFTADEVAKADGATVRVPDEQGRPRDLMLSDDNGKIRVTDVTDVVPDGTVQSVVLPETDLDPRDGGVASPETTTPESEIPPAEPLPNAPINDVTKLPDYKAPVDSETPSTSFVPTLTPEEVATATAPVDSGLAPDDFNFQDLKTELTAPVTRPVEPKETIEPGTPVMIDNKGEGIVTADTGKGVTVEHTPKTKKNGETVLQGKSNVPKKNIQIITEGATIPSKAFKVQGIQLAEKPTGGKVVEKPAEAPATPIIAKEGKFSGSLDIPRAEMPQIREADHPEFVQFAKSRGVEIKQEQVKAHVLKPTQRSYNPEHAEQLPDAAMDKPLTVSSDNRVLDGHNRLVRLLADGERTVTINRIPLPAKEALALMKEFPKTTYKKLGQVGATPKSSNELEKEATAPTRPKVNINLVGRDGFTDAERPQRQKHDAGGDVL